MFAGQEALAKQMGGASLKSKEEALYVHKGSGNFKQHGNGGFKRHNDKMKNHQGAGSSRAMGGWKNQGNNKKFKGKSYSCRKKGHMTKLCTLQTKFMESNVVTSKIKDEWDAAALFVTEEDEDELALTTTLSDQIDYEKDWIVDSGCSNHMTGYKEKL